MVPLRRPLFFFLTIAIAFLFLSAGGTAISPAVGALSGRVIDALGCSISGQEIIIEGSSYQASIIADGKGLFKVPRIPMGTYRVRLGSNGSSSSDSKEVVVHLGRETRVTLIQNLSGSEGSRSDMAITPRVVTDGRGRVVSQELLIDDVFYHLDYGYDENGRLISLSDNLNQRWEYGYSETGKIKSIRKKDHESIQFYYDKRDRLRRTYLSWGYNIFYSDKGNTLTKTVTKFRDQKVVEFSYVLDDQGRKIEEDEGTGQKFGYSYDEDGRLSQIRNLITGEINSSATSGFRDIGDYADVVESYKTGGVAEDDLYEYQFDARGNLIYQRDKHRSLELFREYNAIDLLVREGYLFEANPVLSIEYLYDSSGYLVSKTQSNGIRYYYLRDKDGHLKHKIVKNTMTGEEVDGVVYGPSLSESDSDGFA